MHVVGGVYVEKTEFPEDEVIFGSGGRAACVIRNWDSDVTLSCYVGEDIAGEVSYQAENIWNIQLNSHKAESSVRFSYYHGLSKPIISPSRLPFKNLDPITVEDDVILQFGFIEGQSIVHADRVIYDPQNPIDPEPFDKYGSTAKEIAYVLNRNELHLLTNEQELEPAVMSLLNRENIKTVVVKQGSKGASVYSADEHGVLIRPYVTNHVWPVGSGDTFAAVFAYFWGKERKRSTEAAQLASKATAVYCETRSCKNIKTAIEDDDFKFNALCAKRNPEDVTVYLAGPFFTMSQLWLVEEAKHALTRSGVKVFSPYHDVGLGSADEVVNADLEGLEKADVVLALCDGLDAGTIFEVGYAIKLGLPVVAFGEQTTDESMKMLQGTFCKITREFATAIYHTVWKGLQ